MPLGRDRHEYSFAQSRGKLDKYTLNLLGKPCTPFRVHHTNTLPLYYLMGFFAAHRECCPYREPSLSTGGFSDFVGGVTLFLAICWARAWALVRRLRISATVA